MGVLRFLNKHLFWVFQFLGWGVIAFGLGYASYIEENPILHAVTTAISFFVSGVVATTLYRWLLKRYSNLEFNLINSLKVLGIALVCCVIWVLAIGFFDSVIIIDDVQNPAVQHSESHKFSFSFGFASVGLFLLFFWSLFYYVIKAIRKYNDNRIERLETREKIKSAKLSTLQGHVNGKFLVQALHSIKNQIQIDTKKSRRLLTDLSELLRYSLTNQNVTQISIMEEIEMAQKYVALYHIENPKANALVISNESCFLEKEIPPMLLINSLELILDANEINENRNKTLTLDGSSSTEFVNINISIEGVKLNAFDEDIRFKKINQRLRLMYSTLGSLCLKTNENYIKIQYPLNYNSLEKK